MIPKLGFLFLKTAAQVFTLLHIVPNQLLNLGRIRDALLKTQFRPPFDVAVRVLLTFEIVNSVKMELVHPQNTRFKVKAKFIFV